MGLIVPPCFLMTYNPSYYADLIESCGFVKSQDLYAYEMDAALLAKLTPPRYKPMCCGARAIRDGAPPARSKEVPAGHRGVPRHLQPFAEGTWGFTPLQPGEARHIAGELRTSSFRNSPSSRKPVAS